MKQNETLISAADPLLSYTGRIDFSDPAAPLFIYSGSFLRMRFTGTSLRVVLRNHYFWSSNYIGYAIDGSSDSVVRLSQDPEARIYTLAEHLPPGEHELFLWKRQDGLHYFQLEGVLLDAGAKLASCPPKSRRRILFYGDSVTSGAGCEAFGYEGKADPETQNRFDNAWYAYSMCTARALDAEVHNIAQGGLAVLSGTGYVHMPDTDGWEFTYDKLGYVRELGLSDWDLSKFVPHVAVIALGQNDNYPDVVLDEGHRQRWKGAYHRVLDRLSAAWPKAQFILTTTVMQHDLSWDEMLKEICTERNTPQFCYFGYSRTGRATPGHPRISEHAEMARELTEFIQGLGEQLWQDESDR